MASASKGRLLSSVAGPEGLLLLLCAPRALLPPQLVPMLVPSLPRPMLVLLLGHLALSSNWPASQAEQLLPGWMQQQQQHALCGPWVCVAAPAAAATAAPFACPKGLLEPSPLYLLQPAAG